jgi:hypothetical protein
MSYVLPQRVAEIVDYYARYIVLLQDIQPKNQLSLEKDDYLINS